MHCCFAVFRARIVVVVIIIIIIIIIIDLVFFC